MRKTLQQQKISHGYFEIRFYFLRGSLSNGSHGSEVNCYIQKSCHSRMSMPGCLMFTLINIVTRVFQNQPKVLISCQKFKIQTMTKMIS